MLHAGSARHTSAFITGKVLGMRCLPSLHCTAAGWHAEEIGNPVFAILGKELLRPACNVCLFGHSQTTCIGVRLYGGSLELGKLNTHWQKAQIYDHII